MEIDGKQHAVARRQPNNEQSTLALHTFEYDDVSVTTFPICIHHLGHGQRQSKVLSDVGNSQKTPEETCASRGISSEGETAQKGGERAEECTPSQGIHSACKARTGPTRSVGNHGFSTHSACGFACYPEEHQQEGTGYQSQGVGRTTGCLGKSMFEGGTRKSVGVHLGGNATSVGEFLWDLLDG